MQENSIATTAESLRFAEIFAAQLSDRHSGSVLGSLLRRIIKSRFVPLALVRKMLESGLEVEEDRLPPGPGVADLEAVPVG